MYGLWIRLGGAWQALRVAMLVLVAWAAVSCHEGIDTSREVGLKATLGDDLYGVICDRLGASVFTEDLSGASYHAICHFDASGQYAGMLDMSVLPPISGGQAEQARALSAAKMMRLVERRGELIRAFNSAFPDIDIPNPTTADVNDTVRLHDALLKFTQRLTLLYETHPYDPQSAGLMPTVTQAFGRLFEGLQNNGPARQALMRIAGREGYRPSAVSLGAIRTMLSYPDMRPLLRAQLEVLGPEGSAAPQLQQLLSVAKAELLTSVPTISTLAPFSIVEPTVQPNRPREALEFIAALMLDQDDAYAGTAAGEPRYITAREGRGFAVPAGNTPGVQGTVPAPFADVDLDGLADVDGQGRFIDSAGQPLVLPTPFAIPGEDNGVLDSYGRPESSPYEYIDTTRTLVGALARDLVPLLDPTEVASAEDSQPWLVENEGLMYALAGIHVLAGPREMAQYDHGTGEVVAAGATCPQTPVTNAITGEVLPCTSYERFAAEQSPLPDLMHALGQILADSRSDVMLLALMDLFENHEQVMARLLAAALRVKEIADQHDDYAAQGIEPKAELAYTVPVWDEIAKTAGEMAEHPGLIVDLLDGLADPVMVSSHSQDGKIVGAPSEHLGQTLAAFMGMRDRYMYDTNDINGPALNITDSPPTYANPHHPIEPLQPRNGENRSMFERSAQLIYDGNGVKACNKNGASVYSGAGNVYWPLIGDPYEECELFNFSNVGAFYLNSTLAENDPKRAELVIESTVLSIAMNLLNDTADAVLEFTSGLDGLTQHPSPSSLNRLLFFGANSDMYGQLSDYDASNADSGTAKFISAAIEPLSGVVCPKKSNEVHECSTNDKEDLLRLRDYGTIFGWERLGFYEYLRPALTAFARVSCPSSSDCEPTGYVGETFFLDLISTLYRHWPGMDHGDYCDSTAQLTDARYCSGAGINRYEPILADAFMSDLVPALHEFAKVAAQLSQVTVVRGPDAGQTVKGSEVLEWMVRILFSQEYAKEVGMTDRAGNEGTQWVDGTPQAHVTVFSLFADALHHMDTSFETSTLADAADRKSKWRRARSLLVDQFLSVSGQEGTTQFANPAGPKAVLALLNVLREQVNAQCPDRETTGSCVWARYQLGDQLNQTLGGPTFAAIADLTDALNQNESARRELERFLNYALSSDASLDGLAGMLASISDVMQILSADAEIAPILNAVAGAANPADDPEGPGCADRTVQALKAFSGDDYDQYYVLDYILPQLVTPIDNGTGLTPLEIIVEVMADVNRVDASLDTPFDEQDYLYVFQTLRDFFVSETRGFEQLYYIVRERKKN